MKKVLVLIRKGPFERVRTSETYRMALGLTLAHNEVTLLYLEKGVHNLLPIKPKILYRPSADESMALFEACGIKQVVDQPSLVEWGLNEKIQGVEIVDRETTLELIESADVVMPM